MVTKSTWIGVAAGVLAVIGFIVNVTKDLDNVYDMTTSTLFLVTFIVAFIGAYLAQREVSRRDRRNLTQQQNPTSKKA